QNEAVGLVQAQGGDELVVVQRAVVAGFAQVGVAGEHQVEVPALGQVGVPADVVVELDVGAALVAEVHVRGPGAHVQAVGEVEVGAELQGRVFLVLGDAAEQVVAGQGRVPAEDALLFLTALVLGGGGQGQGQQGGGKRKRKQVSAVHVGSPRRWWRQVRAFRDRGAFGIPGHLLIIFSGVSARPQHKA